MKWPQLPPLRRRVVAMHPSKSKQVQLFEQICILPIGGGLWFPVRNLTKQLVELEERLALTQKSLENLKASVKNEKDYINDEMKRIGFYADTTLVKDPDSGEFKIVDVHQLIEFRLGNNRAVVGGDKATPKIRKETFGNLLVETRRPNNGSQNQNQQKQKQNGQH